MCERKLNRRDTPPAPPFAPPSTGSRSGPFTLPPSTREPSSDDAFDRFTDLGFEAASPRDGKLLCVEPELVQDGRMHIGEVVTLVDGVKSEFVGGAADLAPLNTPACHPARKTINMVIPAVGASFGPGVRRSTFGARPNSVMKTTSVRA